MKNFMLSVVIIMGFVLSGCAHCSKTNTTFNGKTKGMNPYGDGDINVVRESYWGNKGCIERVFKEVPVAEEGPLVIDISDMDPSLFADGDSE